MQHYFDQLKIFVAKHLPAGLELLAPILAIAIALFGFYIASYGLFLNKKKFPHPVRLLGDSIMYVLGGAFSLIWKTIGFLFEAFWTLVLSVFQGAGSSLALSSFSLFKQKTSTTYGSAQYLEGWAKFKLLNAWRKGLTIDGVRRISQQKSQENLCLVSPTGAGKTSRFTKPSTLNVNGSIVQTDPSGEGHRDSSGWLAKRGYDIRLINVTDPEHSLTFNPLHRCTSETDIKKISKTLLDASNMRSSGDPFWGIGAQNILNMLIKLIKKHENPKYHTLANVRYCLNRFEDKALDAFILNHANDEELVEWKAILSAPLKVLQSFIETARTALDPFTDPAIAQITSSDTINFETLRDRPTAIYVQIPEHEAEYYAFFTSLYYNALFKYLMNMPKPGQLPVTVIMEEFGNMAPVPGFASILTSSRKRRISISIITQSIQQVKKLYPDDHETILGGGCRSHLYLPGLQQSTCEHLERLLGKTTLSLKDSDTGRTREIGRHLMTADEIRTMKSHQGLFIYGNSHPVKLTMTPFFKHRGNTRKAAIPPHPLPKNENLTVAYLPLGQSRVDIPPAPPPQHSLFADQPERPMPPPKPVERPSRVEKRQKTEPPPKPVGRPTRVEKRQNAEPPPKPVEVKPQPQSAKPSSRSIPKDKPTAEPSGTNKGSQQHKYLQEIIKRCGEHYGFKSIIEKSILDGKGSIDIALENDEVKVACQISVTSKPEYEFGNVQKCFAAGYDTVIVISADAKTLNKVEKHITKKLDDKDLEHVKFLSPEDLFSFLGTLSNSRTEQVVGGYKVQVKFKKGTEDEDKARKEAMSRVVFDALKRMRGLKK